MSLPPILQALDPVVQSFEALDIRYHIGGSVASSAYGIARATLDVDLVADLKEHQVRPFILRLQDTYYVDEDLVRNAVVRRSSFNLIHLETMLKVDVFVLKSRPYDQAAIARARVESLVEGESARKYRVASPEDVILNKLDWYLQGGCVSDQQWKDIQGIFKVQRSSLDQDYLNHWGPILGLSDLLHRALRDAGMS